jgi:CRISPR-associated protein Cas2
MRILVMFDLPTNTPEERHNATKFRQFLIKDGYYMLQYSVYCRVCKGSDNTEKHIKRVTCHLPPAGSIRALEITENQYNRMKLLIGPKKIAEQIDERQLLLL